MKEAIKNNKQEIYLEDRLIQYDKWIREGKLQYSSKVIPINESIESKQWILSTKQAIQILKDAGLFVLSKCECRLHYKRCNNPIEVCFLLNDVAEKYLINGMGKKISIEQANGILKKANQYGLVHLTIFTPGQNVFALCNCCECCCHDLQFLKNYNRPDLISHSDYIEYTDSTKCTNCGICTDRCVFSARKWKDNELTIDIDNCFGCGLCVTQCPEDAVKMIHRDSGSFTKPKDY